MADWIVRKSSDGTVVVVTNGPYPAAEKWENFGQAWTYLGTRVEAGDRVVVQVRD